MLGLFTLAETDSDTDSDLDSKPDGYNVLCRNAAWSQIQIPVRTANYRNGIRVPSHGHSASPAM